MAMRFLQKGAACFFGFSSMLALRFSLHFPEGSAEGSVESNQARAKAEPPRIVRGRGADIGQCREFSKEVAGPTTETLEGAISVLRPVLERDLPHFQAWDEDPAIIELMGQKYATISIYDWYQLISSGRYYRAWAIDTKDGHLIGELELVHLNWRNGSAEVRICIGEKAYWSKGFGGDAIQTILQLAFERYGLRVIYLRVFQSNVRAIRLYQRLGFRKEAILQPCLRRGDRSAVLLMNIDRGSWQQAQAGLAQRQQVLAFGTALPSNQGQTEYVLLHREHVQVLKERR